MIMQIMKHSVEAYYELADKPEDIVYQSIVGFSNVIIVIWSVTHLFGLYKSSQKGFTPEAA